MVLPKCYISLLCCVSVMIANVGVNYLLLSWQHLSSAMSAQICADEVLLTSWAPKDGFALTCYGVKFQPSLALLRFLH